MALYNPQNAGDMQGLANIYGMMNPGSSGHPSGGMQQGMWLKNMFNRGMSQSDDANMQSIINRGQSQSIAADDRAFMRKQQEANFNMGQQKWTLQQQLLNKFLNGGSGGTASVNPQIDYGQVAGLLGDARNLRNTTFAQGSLGRSNDSYELGKLRDLGSSQSQQMGALQDRGHQQIQNNYLGALRDLRSSTYDRSMSPEGAAGMKSDLLRQKIRSGKDLQQGLMSDESSRQQQALQLYAQIRSATDQLNSGNELNERLQRLGNPEMAANMNLQAQTSNVNNSQQNLSRMLAMLGMGG